MSNRLAMIVRADQGGLGNQTWEFWRHLQPEHTVVMLMHGDARGVEDQRCYTDRYGALWHAQGPQLPDPTLMAVLSDCDVLMTVEGWYNDSAVLAARAAGVRTVLVANPELYDHGGARADTVILPTYWERHRLPFADVIPQPVAADRFRLRSGARDGCTTLFHPGAPAMLDRNGTEQVLECLHLVRNPCRLIVRSPGRTGSVRHGNVELLWDSHNSSHYWDCYPDEADVLLLPRRYGGLCLPAQEAAALGIPSLMLDTEPSRSWPFTFDAPALRSMVYPMKGGDFDVYGSDPHALAGAIDHAIDNADEVRLRSELALEWAADHAWDLLLPVWQEAIRG